MLGNADDDCRAVLLHLRSARRRYGGLAQERADLVHLPLRGPGMLVDARVLGRREEGEA
jgi:hypothetical protein